MTTPETNFPSYFPHFSTFLKSSLSIKSSQRYVNFVSLYTFTIYKIIDALDKQVWICHCCYIDAFNNNAIDKINIIDNKLSFSGFVRLVHGEKWT